MGSLVRQAGEAFGLAAAMGPPKGGRHDVVLAGGKAVLHRDQRPVRHIGIAFEATDRLFPGRPLQAAQPPPGQAAEAQGQGGQQAGMQPGIEAGEQVEMGGGNEESDGRQQRHQARPEGFPGKRHPRQADLALQSGGPDFGCLDRL